MIGTLPTLDPTLYVLAAICWLVGMMLADAALHGFVYGIQFIAASRGARRWEQTT